MSKEDTWKALIEPTVKSCNSCLHCRRNNRGIRFCDFWGDQTCANPDIYIYPESAHYDVAGVKWEYDGKSK